MAPSDSGWMAILLYHQGNKTKAEAKASWLNGMVTTGDIPDQAWQVNKDKLNQS